MGAPDPLPPPEGWAPRRNPFWLLALAFGAVYIIWGSTYLAIGWAIDERAGFPPFLMAASRNVAAGAALYAVLRLTGRAPSPTARQWAAGVATGVLMLACGNGTVTWSERRVPSGLVSLMVAMVPMWMVLVGAIGPAGVRPTKRTLAGLLAGSAGIVLLIGPIRLATAFTGAAPDAGAAAAGVDPLAAAALLASTLAWSVGSLLSRRLDRPGSPVMTAAVQMIAGGLALTIPALLAGEHHAFDPARLGARALLSWGYLVVFGSIIAFTAYSWLLGATTPARVSTYAYVNPVVAVGLGVALNAEPFSTRIGLATAVIVGAVALIVSRRAAAPLTAAASPPDAVPPVALSTDQSTDWAIGAAPRPGRRPGSEREAQTAMGAAAAGAQYSSPCREP